jgi:putative nucleotidyltransferase with HDIG domain
MASIPIKGLQDLTQKNRLTSRILLLVVMAVLSFFALTFSFALRPSFLPIQVGSVAPQDIQSPISLTYESEVQTESARKDAERSVDPIYLPADPSIARKKIEDLQATLGFINSVRIDQYSTRTQKNSDLQSLKLIRFSLEETTSLLELPDTRWESIQQESLRVLEEVMRTTIRSDQVYEARQSVPSRISLSFSPNSNSLISRLVEPQIEANSQFSEDRTREAIDNARSSVQPVTRSLLNGEIIVRRGQIVSPLIYEALVKFNLVQPKSNYSDLIAPAALVILVFVFIGFYFMRRKISPVNNWRSLLLISVTFLVFLFFARFITPNRTVIPYLFPIAAFGLTISCLFNLEIGMLLSLALSILSAYGLSSGLDLTVYYTLTSLVGILVLGKGLRVYSFFAAAAAIGFAGCAVIIAYRLIPGNIDLVGIMTLLGSSFINGLASASLTLLFQYVFAQLLGTTTALQLLDLSRPDHPVMQFMLRNAPGSYQHSLQVANLAEQAAEVVGADVLLTRVGAIYHDIGKAANPQFFIENQITGKSNPHEELNPETSAAIIIRHIEEGVQIAKKYRLPPRIIDFIREHHGTLLARYQYARAVQASAGQSDPVNIEMFRYPGPSPRSKETALLMLADGCEARARAEVPKSEDELRTLVKKVFDYLQQEGQLDQTSLTLRDLNSAAESFTSTLRNTYHPRILYPEIKTPSSQTEPVQYLIKSDDVTIGNDQK